MTETLKSLRTEYVIVCTIVAFFIIQEEYPHLHEIWLVLTATFISYHTFKHVSTWTITKESERKKKAYHTAT